MAKDSAYVEFPLPEGFVLPEGVEEDEDFNSVCTLRVKPGGQVMCLKSVEGVEVTPSTESKTIIPEEKSTGSGMVEAFRGETKY